MKKLVFAAAAIAAGVAVADIQSANVVGYSTSSHTKSTYIGKVPGFTGVSSAKKVSDLKAASGNATKLTSSNFKLLMFGKNGNPMYVKDDETLKTFSPEAYAEFGGVDSIKELSFYFYQTDGHWYMGCDAERKYAMDDYPIVQGRGYIVFTGAILQKGATLTDSGAVAVGDLPIALPKSTYFLSGNSMPRDFQLKEFKAESGNATKLTSSNFKLLFFGKDGNMQYVKDNERLASFCPEAYAEFGGEGSIKEFSLYYYQADSHWYLGCDSERKYVMDDYVIQAGEGFTVFCGAILQKGATFTIPAAIEAPAAE